MREQNMAVSEEVQQWYTWEWDKGNTFKNIQLSVQMTNFTNLCKFFFYYSANIFERSVADALTQSNAFEDISGVVHHINKQFRIVKAYKEAEFHSETERFYAPLQRSETRFARYQHRGLDNFRHNFGIIYDILKTRKDDPKSREFKHDIHRIDNAEFVLSLASSLDIFDRIAQIFEKC